MVLPYCIVLSQVNLLERHDQQPLAAPFHQCKLLVDVTPVFIERPCSNAVQRRFYSGKYKRHCVKYECAVRASDGLICWVSPMFRGPVHDITIFRRSGLLAHLLPGECMLADKAYVAGDLAHVMFTPYKGKNLTPDEKTYNNAQSAARIEVEHSFGLLKKFGCISGEWRADVTKIEIIFYVCVCITNLKIKGRN